MKNIFWIAGEGSGDLHAAQVIQELRNRQLIARHYGIGGPRMQALGFEPSFPFKRFAVMGFAEVVKHLKFFLKVRSQIGHMFKHEEPDLVVLVDYPGFNLQIAKMADDLSIPVLYYICPQFWAWKHNRVYKLRDYTRHVACILPFERELLKIHRVNSSYVGHPIAEEVKIRYTREEFAQKYGLHPDKKWIGFFPGSREMEVKRMLPVFIDAIRSLDPNRYDFIISKASAFSYNYFYDVVKARNIEFTYVIGDDNYDIMKHCDALAATSGTVTLEAAYIGTPTVICYKANQLSYEMGKRLVRIDHIGLPNIILNGDVLPELIQHEANGKNIAKHLRAFAEPSPQRERVCARLSELQHLLGEQSASKNVADLVIAFLEHGDMFSQIVR